MVHCRAYLLLERDVRELERNPRPGITAYLVEEKPLVCYATVSGLPGTEMAEGVFHVGLKCTEHYNERFPKVFFNTIPFHPNIHPTSGHLAVDFPRHFPPKLPITMKNILLFIQNLLTNPILKRVVNEDAYNLLTTNPRHYKKASKFCAKQSAAMFEHLSKKVFKLEESPRPPTKCPPVQIKDECRRALPRYTNQIPFEKYYETWKGIATSKPEMYETTAITNDLIAHWERQATTKKPKSVLKSKNNPQVKERRKKASKSAASGLERIAMMKKLYLGQKEEESHYTAAAEVTGPRTTPRDSFHSPVTSNTDANVDDLLKWTETLDVNGV